MYNHLVIFRKSYTDTHIIFITPNTKHIFDSFLLKEKKKSAIDCQWDIKFVNLTISLPYFFLLYDIGNLLLFVKKAHVYLVFWRNLYSPIIRGIINIAPLNIILKILAANRAEYCSLNPQCFFWIFIHNQKCRHLK